MTYIYTYAHTCNYVYTVGCRYEAVKCISILHAVQLRLKHNINQNYTQKLYLDLPFKHELLWPCCEHFGDNSTVLYIHTYIHTYIHIWYMNIPWDLCYEICPYKSSKGCDTEDVRGKRWLYKRDHSSVSIPNTGDDGQKYLDDSFVIAS